MRRFNFLIVSFLCLFGAAGIALADAKVEQQPMGPDGDSLGCSVSPHGGHVAVLVAKGSRFDVLLDGVEGPKIEALQYAIYGSPYQSGSSWGGQIPVLFSNGGEHSAYIGKVGDEYIVVEDGKEIARGPNKGNGANITVPLEFSAGGKHLFYMDIDATGRYRVVVDGKPGPSTGFPQPLIVSPDGEHYAYGGFVNSNIGNGVPNWAVVDGRQVNYIGDMQYTGRGVLLSTLRTPDNNSVLCLNGKPDIKANSINPMWMSPDGREIAMIITPKSGDPSFLSVNGKIVPETQGVPVGYVYFSPDGRRYAALCNTKTGSKFMIIDGKKSEEYQDIPHEIGSSVEESHWTFMTGVVPVPITSVRPSVPGFTGDSSRFVYVATQGGRQFLVVDDQESNGFQQILPVLSLAGGRVGAIAIAPNGKQHVIIDGKDQEPGPPAVAGGGPTRCYCLTFTPDGTRYAFISGATLVVDGLALPGIASGQKYVFSPDDKHIAYMSSDGGYTSVFLDGKIVDNSPSAGQTGRIFFSPDSQHLFTLKTMNLQAMGTKDSVLLTVDGKPATHYSDNGLGGASTCNFDFNSDGVLSFAARTDSNFRLFHVTPAADANISTMLAAAPAPKNK
jgi:hypothetical protein